VTFRAVATDLRMGVDVGLKAATNNGLEGKCAEP